MPVARHTAEHFIKSAINQLCSHRRYFSTIVHIDVIIIDSLFTTLSQRRRFFERPTLNFASPSFHRRVNYTRLSFQPRFVFSPSIWPSLINVNVSDCCRGRLRSEMRSGNAGNEWRPKLGYARLQPRLKERAPESIIFRESWPGERFQNFIFLFFTQDLQRIILSCERFITLFTMLRKDNYVYNERNFFRKISVASRISILFFERFLILTAE